MPSQPRSSGPSAAEIKAMQNAASHMQFGSLANQQMANQLAQHANSFIDRAQAQVLAPPPLKPMSPAIDVLLLDVGKAFTPQRILMVGTRGVVTTTLSQAIADAKNLGHIGVAEPECAAAIGEAMAEDWAARLRGLARQLRLSSTNFSLRLQGLTLPEVVAGDAALLCWVLPELALAPAIAWAASLEKKVSREDGMGMLHGFALAFAVAASVVLRRELTAGLGQPERERERIIALTERLRLEAGATLGGISVWRAVALAQRAHLGSMANEVPAPALTITRWLDGVPEPLAGAGMVGAGRVGR